MMKKLKIQTIKWYHNFILPFIPYDEAIDTDRTVNPPIRITIRIKTFKGKMFIVKEKREVLK